MGLMLTAKCPCGVDTRVLEGIGETEGSACFPAWCKTCEALVSAPTQRGEPHCPRCKTPVELIQHDGSPGHHELVWEEPVQCPRCGAPTLRFEPCAIWD